MKQRPVFLELDKIRLPVTALVSIAHRISGVVLFVASPFWLLLFAQLTQGWHLLADGFVRLLLWGSLLAYLFHFLAGLRHMLEEYAHPSLIQARYAAAGVLFLWTLLAINATIWIWL